MSTTAGYLPLPAPGMYTSPTRFTPSLAGIVTLESLVMPSARAEGARASADSRQSASRQRRTTTQRGGGRQLLAITGPWLRGQTCRCCPRARPWSRKGRSTSLSRPRPPQKRARARPAPPRQGGPRRFCHQTRNSPRSFSLWLEKDEDVARKGAMVQAERLDDRDLPCDPRAQDWTPALG